MCGVSHALFLHLCGEVVFLCSQAIGDKTPSHCWGKITVQLVVYRVQVNLVMLVKLRLQIPSFRQVGHDSASNESATSAGTPSKSFHVFILEVASNCSDEFSSQSRVHRVEKRYSQFLGLHIEVQRMIFH